MVITLLRVSVAAWSATPVRALYHLCSSLNLMRVNQSPSPFFMENGNDGRLIWALKKGEGDWFTLIKLRDEHKWYSALTGVALQAATETLNKVITTPKSTHAVQKWN